jgi:AAA domain, putative AbiEii toxin, Type IV TA system/AAA ATPase domain
MAGPLFLESLEIHRFRAFDHLRIERLGRVNLVVGKNNVGKSSLLEALWLYANQGHPIIVWKILEARDEGRGPERTLRARSPMEEDVGIEDYADSVKQLFHRNSDTNYEARIGPQSIGNRTLTISLGFNLQKTAPILKTSIGQQQNAYGLDDRAYRLQEGNGERCVMVAANGLDALTLEKFWDSVALTDLEDDVLSALRLIAPNVERVNMLTGRKKRNARTPVVKVAGMNEPVPLKSLGDGMNRMFGISLALVSARNGMLLIDEIENGLHYSVQSNVWRLVFEVARRLNVQVFATTHSWDCIAAFQQAAQEYEQDEGILIRLIEKKGKIVADSFNENELEIATREEIEVR